MSECAGAGSHPECAARRDDVIIKYDGAGQPVYASNPKLGNRAERRALARAARRER